MVQRGLTRGYSTRHAASRRAIEETVMTTMASTTNNAHHDKDRLDAHALNKTIARLAEYKTRVESWISSDLEQAKEQFLAQDSREAIVKTMRRVHKNKLAKDAVDVVHFQLVALRVESQAAAHEMGVPKNKVRSVLATVGLGGGSTSSSSSPSDGNNTASSSPVVVPSDSVLIRKAARLAKGGNTTMAAVSRTRNAGGSDPMSLQKGNSLRNILPKTTTTTSTSTRGRNRRLAMPRRNSVQTGISSVAAAIVQPCSLPAKQQRRNSLL